MRGLWTLVLGGLLVAASGAAAAEMTVELKGTHLCCGQCVKAVGQILQKVEGVTGKCDQEAGTVTITARVRDEDGNTGTLVAPALPITDGRFIGTGSLMGRAVKLSGRIDAPAGELVPVARITATFTVSDGHHGRVIGSRKGP